ncbi:hypothetical protein CBR_g40704 [Chara braunii]|uniref:Uncharacterized protein n=1 Tax=Chara braunii TaxID=69332 RepID=A0A388LUJ9_CHABU|nr:hypothetical protein CBR_g40704 [Chara braunii]|eukprot:GBG85892.1 hypothetical protein CBR_g40704 [Chara braunii]
MSTRLDKRLELLGLTTKTATTDKGCNNEGDTEVARLRMENEMLRKRLEKDSCLQGDDKVACLQRELAELRRQIMAKQTDSDEIYALKQEIEELRGTAYVKTNFETEIVGLRREISMLRDQSMQAEEEAITWKNEALRLGNKRGHIAVSTPECSGRGALKPHWTHNIRLADKWREELRKLQGNQQVLAFEVAMLKEIRAEAEKKRMKVEMQVKSLQEKLSKLTAPDDEKEPTMGGTNLKERLKAVAIRSTRKGKKATPGRVGQKTEDSRDKGLKVNDRYTFIENEKKKLRGLKKLGLKPYCKETSIKLEQVHETINELAEYRANKAFEKGIEKGKRSGAEGECSVHDIDDDETQTSADGRKDADERSVEL